MKKKFILIFVLSLMVVISCQMSGDWKQIAVIPLTSEDVSAFEEVRLIKGGKFVPEGWQSTDSLSQIKIVLKEGFYADESGAIEVDMTRFNPMTQAYGRKHHFFNLYASPEGNNWYREWKEDQLANRRVALPFFNLRAGRHYKNEEGMGIKILWKGHEKRHEKAPFGPRKDWSESSTYTFRAEWDTDSLCVFLNGEQIAGPLEFANRDADAPLKYVFVGKDDQWNDAIWFGFAGPVYKEIRCYKK